MLKKSEYGAATALVSLAIRDDEISCLYPDLWAFLTQMNWEDGSPRETGSLLLFLDGGQLKAMLRDKSQGACLWVSASTLGDLLAVADKSITNVEADWRRDRFTQPMSKKKR